MVNLRNILKLKEAQGFGDIDLAPATEKHKLVILRKAFLKKIYLDFYNQFAKRVNLNSPAVVVELGSGGGFIKELFPNVITTDLLAVKGIDKCFSGEKMPFEDQSVNAFVMLDVFHHVANSRTFLREMERCLKPSGKVIMIEPANTMWGRFIYKNFHHEAFDLDAGWQLQNSGPLSGANGALPWIVFVRDRALLQRDFPALAVKDIYYHTPLRYLLSGGVTRHQLIPTLFYPFVKFVEEITSPISKYFSMFMTVEVEKLS